MHAREHPNTISAVKLERIARATLGNMADREDILVL